MPAQSIRSCIIQLLERFSVSELSKRTQISTDLIERILFERDISDNEHCQAADALQMLLLESEISSRR